jgi:hypothetical protein
MSTYALAIDDSESFDDFDHFERVSEIRGQLLADMTAGIQALQRATTTLNQLRSNTIYDIELAEGRDGGDVATFLDDSIRYGRAAYAVVHTIIDKETP